jgi:hypothetical protein
VYGFSQVEKGNCRGSRSVGAPSSSGGDGNRDTVRTVWYVRGVMGDVGGGVFCVGGWRTGFRDRGIVHY